MFAADAPAVVGMATPATQRKSKIQISLIDPRRAQNVAIQLAQFKRFASDDDIVSSVSSFTADQLLILTSILPTADERATVKSFDGNSSCLGRAEQFFVAVRRRGVESTVTPESRERRLAFRVEKFLEKKLPLPELDPDLFLESETFFIDDDAREPETEKGSEEHGKGF